jgi:hypothetical protein
MMIRNKFNGYSGDGRRLYPGGGGGQTTSYTQNIPEYAQPYVERMLGATEKQVFQFDDKGETITGFQPYQSFRQAQEKAGMSGESVAGFSPMQKQAMQGLANYQLPGQTGAASGMAADLAGRALQAGQYAPSVFGNQYNAPSPYQAGRFGVRDVGVGSFTQPGAAQAYMSPYQQAVTDIEKREATRASDILKQQQQAQAVQQGAFGGGRQAIIEAERQRNLSQQLGDIQARGGQAAFTQAQQQFNAENLQAGLQAQLANQQAYQQSQQAREQSRQFGYGQGMTAADLAARYGLEGQRATEQSRQFGAGLGMQGIEQARAATGMLGELGQQQFAQQMGLMGQQMDVGAKEQAYEQARLNQVIQDYATQQQYPFIQLGTLSNMLRGLPMQASTTQMYQAQPSLLQQGVGLAGAAANLKQAGVFGKEGGAVKEMASGGIASGIDRYELDDMVEKLSDDQLKSKLNPKNTDPETLGIAQAEKQRRDHIRKGMAGGGAVAFSKGEKVEEPKKEAPAPKAAAPKAAAPVEKSPYQAEYKQAAATPSPITSEIKALREQQADASKTAKLGVEGVMKQKQEAYKQFNIDPETIFKQERAENKRFLDQAQGDAKKAEHLRYAQMFAKFGSTPGPILKAGLVAINDTIPDLLDDQEQARNIQRGVQKSLFELDKAELLYKKGNYDDAQKLVDGAKGRVADLSIATSKLIADEYENRQKNLATLASTELKGEFDVKEARIRAAATSGRNELAGDRLDEQRRKAIDVEHYRTMKGQYEQRASLEKQLTIYKDPEKQKSAQAKLDAVNRRIMEDRNSRFIERGLQPPTSPLNPQEITQPSGAASDTSGWGELRVKGS